MQPVQIENIDNEGTFEITEAEFELFKSVVIRIDEREAAADERDAAMQRNMEALAAAMIAQGEQIIAAIAALSVTVNVPEQPSAAPQVTLNVPEQPAPVVNFKLPPEKKKKIKVDIVRNSTGAISGATGSVE